MTPERHARIKEVFLLACERPLAERSGFLQQACGDDDELRAAVAELLRHHSEVQATKSAASEATMTSVTLLSETAPGGAGADGGPRWETGQVIASRYRIVDLLGRGGMGEVYRAEDLQLRQMVALKFLPPAFAQEAMWLDRFRQEVRLARQITHANVCRVHDFGEAEGQYFISMEYVDGENLKTLLSRIGRLPGDKAMQIARQLCAGLAAAHARDVLHRDLKPANIMLDGRGQVRITDFGLAATREEIRGHEVLSGTPAYMAPEQLCGRDVSVRSDIYSLGLVLYELFTGRAPFHADSAAGYAHVRESTRPTPPSRLIPEIQADVERVLLSCLERVPEDRPASVLAVVAALPGSDLLAAALAAGLTPSPDMVAAAGVDKAVSGAWAVAGLAAFAILLFAAMLVGSYNHPLCRTPTAVSPQLLAERAREILQEVHSEPAGGEASGFLDQASHHARLKPTRQRGRAAPRYAVSEDNQLVFWYRTSPAQLTPTSPLNVLFGGARVTPDDPPLTEPGMAQVVLDNSARLLGLQIVAPFLSPPTIPTVPVNWTALLSRVGVDADGLTPCAPETLPPVPADAIRAWRGRRTADGTPVRIETAERAGRPVYLAAIGDHSGGAAPPKDAGRLGLRAAIVDYTWKVLLALCAAVSLPLARLNIQRGRSDLYGAWRLAIFVFLARMALWLLQAQHVADLGGELSLLAFALIGGAAEALLLWLFYVALEPYARRYWPHLLVSWNRLWRGRLGDPLVAQQVLVGAVFGAAWAVLAGLEQPLATWLGMPTRQMLRAESFFSGLLNTRYALAANLDIIRSSIYNALLFLLLLVLLRMLLRRPVWAAVVGALLIAPLSVPRGGSLALSWLFLGGGLALFTWCMVRFGLLSAVTGLYVAFVLARAPLTFHLGMWYGDLSLIAILFTSAVALYGFLGARAGAPGQRLAGEFARR